MSITTAQIRGARGILNWSQQDLAQRTGISATSIGAIENGQTTPRESTLSTIRKTLENGGIEFIGLDGVRLRTGDVRIFQGREGFWDFYEDIYSTVQETPGEILVSNADERLFEKWIDPENLKKHVNRMRGTKGVSYKILVKEGDTHLLATPDYAEYRWTPKDQFSSTVPFYVYGKKLAILLFSAEPTVILIKYDAVADAYRHQFMGIWKNSSLPAETTAKSV
jgi:transcriptional regulator with XRE-family HTH domain